LIDWSVLLFFVKYWLIWSTFGKVIVKQKGMLF